MFTARMERSVALAKHMAQVLDVDLFDEHRRGRFREIVQNCTTCAHNTACLGHLSDGKPLAMPLAHCRNKAIFMLGQPL